MVDHAGSHLGSLNGGDPDAPGWAAYISSLDQFRKDLKQIHLLEEEMSRVKRDREILVTRLIKTTKSRPTKSDLTALATSYSHKPESSYMSSRASSISVNSTGSAASKEGKRAGKLQEAQAELLGCEEHLRSLEVRVEAERNKVMMRGLEERFRAMEAVGRMWVGQAKRGLDDLEKVHGECATCYSSPRSHTLRVRVELISSAELPPNAFELDSNGSIAPSQSASQIGYEDEVASARRAPVPFPKHLHGPGSITGSIVEEDEDGSSGDEAQGNLVMHENRPGDRAASRATAQRPNAPAKPSPLGVPSVNTHVRPLSSLSPGYGAGAGARDGNDSDSDVPYGAGRRRVASDIGAMGYRPPTGRSPLRRTFSHDQTRPNVRRGSSDTSSVNGQKKKRGFFASISRFFKGPSRKREGSVRSGRDSPPYGSGRAGGGGGGGGWHTRTDSNIKRSTSTYGRRGGGDDSSSDEDTGNLVSVSNNRNSTWSVENVGRQGANIKRSSTMPVASGLIPSKPTRSDLGGGKRNDSQSTVTGRKGVAAVPARAQSPTASVKKANEPTTISRSNTVKSTKSTTSTATAKSAATGTGTGKKKPRANGSLTRAAVGSQQAAEGRTIMSLVDMPPPMIEVPKAPKSHVTPHMELAKAPGSSLVTSATEPRLAMNGDAQRPKSALARSNSARLSSKPSPEAARSTTPLPPSRMLSPPLKSAMRPSSPSTLPPPSPPMEPSKPMFSITAPGPVELGPEEPHTISMPKPAPRPAPTETEADATTKAIPPPNVKRHSYASTTADEASVYESAIEDGGDDAYGRNADSSSEDDDEFEGHGYQVFENDKVSRADLHVGPPEIVRLSHDGNARDDESIASDGTATGGSPVRPTAATAAPAHAAAPVPAEDDKVTRRKSVRITAPDSPHHPVSNQNQPLPPTPTHAAHAEPDSDEEYRAHAHDRAVSPPPQRATDAQWSTRIGRVREDSSDEEVGGDEDYRRARRGLIRNTGKWETVKGGVTPEKMKKKSGSVRSKASVKISRAGSAKA
jgi:hypothetical protein